MATDWQIRANTGVGYMPQEIALFNDFTIRQLFQYYGLIYQMNSQTINDCMNELKSMLQLAPLDQSVGTLSGGQQRLVSLAITLIHSPKLLLLDEPTVGVDSILRYRIWHYLDQLCHKNNTTVIITTHYTEEARRADSVAFIYNGNCLANQSPNKLIDTYRCSTLDDVYYKLCNERRFGYLDRYLIAGLKPMEIFAIQMLINFIHICLQSLELVVFVINLLNYPLYGTYLDIYLIVVLSGIHGMTLGTTIMLCFNDSLVIIILLISIIFPQIFISSLIWPIESFPDFMRFIQYIAPMNLSTTVTHMTINSIYGPNAILSSSISI
ncbi:ABC transporter G family member 20-like [Oppia nitens]|uniref:ABC transporter G family member 20-like n=1 Tax=Oppia nitens TaxID=1686743 RepID=UPI0023DC5B33|nr:ABC transporter G family member 20-like [Oppia nitens]